MCNFIKAISSRDFIPVSLTSGFAPRPNWKTHIDYINSHNFCHDSWAVFLAYWKDLKVTLPKYKWRTILTIIKNYGLSHNQQSFQQPTVSILTSKRSIIKVHLFHHHWDGCRPLCRWIQTWVQNSVTLIQLLTEYYTTSSNSYNT